MNSISATLQDTIKMDYQKLRHTFSNDSYCALQILIRRYDFISVFICMDKANNTDELQESLDLFNFGWAPIFKQFLNNHDFEKFRMFMVTQKEDYNWANSVLLYSGRLAICQQLLDYEKADIVQFSQVDDMEFQVSFTTDKIGDAYFERKSVDFVREQLMENIIKEKRLEDRFKIDEIREKMKEVIKNPSGQFISYTTTPEIDEYYGREGYYRVLKMNNYEDFDDNDVFGGIDYRYYLDFVQFVCGVAMMHTDACLLLHSANPGIDMHYLLTYAYYKDKTINHYSALTGMEYKQVEQIIACVTLNKENYDTHINIPGIVPPMYFELSENSLIRSASGCLDNPILFLNRELRRKFKKDYEVAVNNRENRFRKDLFLFFEDERVVKIPNEIRISFSGLKTDIDAVAYDKITNTLGLFQLKWQDPFGHSMKERRNRMSNMFPKAQEWVEKIIQWTATYNSKTILESLQIRRQCPEAKEISEIYLFVISRYDMHFLNNKTDERAAWGSWYQLVEAQASVNVQVDNPIEAMFVKLRIFTPDLRAEMEGTPQHRPFEAKVGDYKVIYIPS